MRVELDGREHCTPTQPSPPSSPLTNASYERRFLAAIHLITGPMFSGKTKELKRRIDRRRIALKNTKLDYLVIKYAGDTRYGDVNTLVTHDRQSSSDKCYGVRDLREVDALLGDCRYLFIDEGQFFPHLAHYCVTWAQRGITIFVAALLSQANHVMWKEVVALMPWCQEVLTLTAVCMRCGGEATLSVLNTKDTVDVKTTQTHADTKTETHTNKTDANTAEIIRVGGNETFSSSCLHCSPPPKPPPTTNTLKPISDLSTPSATPTSD
jgi:thymidine kinase